MPEWGPWSGPFLGLQSGFRVIHDDVKAGVPTYVDEDGGGCGIVLELCGVISLNPLFFGLL